MNENTNDLTRLGYREYDLLADLLKALSDNKIATNTTLGDKVNWEFNPNSGNVFLIDEDYQAYMMNDDGFIEEHVFCSNCGAEGFKTEFWVKPEDLTDQQKEELDDIEKDMGGYFCTSCETERVSYQRPSERDQA